MLDGFDSPTYYKTIFPTRRKSQLQQQEIGALRLIILITLKRQDGIEIKGTEHIGGIPNSLQLKQKVLPLPSKPYFIQADVRTIRLGKRTGRKRIQTVYFTRHEYHTTNIPLALTSTTRLVE